ncbi:MAG: nitroreductase family protein [Tannerellaceae bacterium]|nr:nitroreductase family protein [Tannerellaceae bacterium]
MMRTKLFLLVSIIILTVACSNRQNPGQASVTVPSGSVPDDVLLELVKTAVPSVVTLMKIAPEILDKITTVALLAPSSHGQNPVEFIIVEDKEMLRELARRKRIGAGPVERATAAIVVISNRNNGGELWIEDASVASTYILLAAEYYGIGACWNHIRGREGIKTSSDEEIKELLGIPSHYAVLNIVALGHKKENKPPRTEDGLDFNKVHKEKF